MRFEELENGKVKKEDCVKTIVYDVAAIKEKYDKVEMSKVVENKSVLKAMILPDYIKMLEDRDVCYELADRSRNNDDCVTESVMMELAENINEWLLPCEHIFACMFAKNVMGVRKTMHLPYLHI